MCQRKLLSQFCFQSFYRFLLYTPFSLFSHFAFINPFFFPLTDSESTCIYVILTMFDYATYFLFWSTSRTLVLFIHVYVYVEHLYVRCCFSKIYFSSIISESTAEVSKQPTAPTQQVTKVHLVSMYPFSPYSLQPTETLAQNCRSPILSILKPITVPSALRKHEDILKFSSLQKGAPYGNFHIWHIESCETSRIVLQCRENSGIRYISISKIE